MLSYDIILKVIDSFYDTARSDILIGYHFRVIDDFDEHIPRIADFWNLQLNGELKRKENLPFNLLDTHIPLKINPGEIDRWVKLFSENLDKFISTNEISENEKQIWLEKVDIFKKKLKHFI